MTLVIEGVLDVERVVSATRIHRDVEVVTPSRKLNDILAAAQRRQDMFGRPRTGIDRRHTPLPGQSDRRVRCSRRILTQQSCEHVQPVLRGQRIRREQVRERPLHKGQVRVDDTGRIQEVHRIKAALPMDHDRDAPRAGHLAVRVGRRPFRNRELVQRIPGPARAAQVDQVIPAARVDREGRVVPAQGVLLAMGALEADHVSALAGVEHHRLEVAVNDVRSAAARDRGGVEPPRRLPILQGGQRPEFVADRVELPRRRALVVQVQFVAGFRPKAVHHDRPKEPVEGALIRLPRPRAQVNLVEPIPQAHVGRHPRPRPGNKERHRPRPQPQLDLLERIEGHRSRHPEPTYRRLLEGPFVRLDVARIVKRNPIVIAVLAEDQERSEDEIQPAQRIRIQPHRRRADRQRVVPSPEMDLRDGELAGRVLVTVGAVDVEHVVATTQVDTHALDAALERVQIMRRARQSTRKVNRPRRRPRPGHRRIVVRPEHLVHAQQAVRPHLRPVDPHRRQLTRRARGRLAINVEPVARAALAVKRHHAADVVQPVLIVPHRERVIAVAPVNEDGHVRMDVLDPEGIRSAAQLDEDGHALDGGVGNRARQTQAGDRPGTDQPVERRRTAC